MRILVRRLGALGDVVLTTPIIRRLRLENPEADIAVQTAYPDVFRNSPHRVWLLPQGNLPYPWTAEGGLDREIDFTLAYEQSPGEHIVCAYMRAAFGDPGKPEDRCQELFPETAGLNRLASAFSGGRVVAVHAARAGWRNRTLPEQTWLDVVDGLHREGLFPMMVGTGRDALPKAKAAAFHSTDVLAQAAVIACCACFVGSDSGLLHVAGATNVPIVSVFTCASPAVRMPWRNGVLGDGCTAVLPEGLDCLGCLARAPVPSTSESCERGDTACVRAVRPDVVVAAVVRAVRDR